MLCLRSPTAHRIPGSSASCSVRLRLASSGASALGLGFGARRPIVAQQIARPRAEVREVQRAAPQLLLGVAITRLRKQQPEGLDVQRRPPGPQRLGQRLERRLGLGGAARPLGPQRVARLLQIAPAPLQARCRSVFAFR